MDAVHRVLTGQATQRWHLIAGGIVVTLWILIDVLQFCGWDGPSLIRLFR